MAGNINLNSKQFKLFKLLFETKIWKTSEQLAESYSSVYKRAVLSKDISPVLSSFKATGHLESRGVVDDKKKQQWKMTDPEGKSLMEFYQLYLDRYHAIVVARKTGGKPADSKRTYKSRKPVAPDKGPLTPQGLLNTLGKEVERIYGVKVEVSGQVQVKFLFEFVK